MFVQINIFENSKSGEMNENLFNFMYTYLNIIIFLILFIDEYWILLWSKGNVKF